MLREGLAMLGINSGNPGHMLSLEWPQAAGLILSVGALGTAAYGMTEAFGKFLAIPAPWITHGKNWAYIGLPYAGLGHVTKAIKPFEPALSLTYGPDYKAIIVQQYREGRSTGSAPDTIKQGIRLALPMMSVDAASKVIEKAWGLTLGDAERLARALQSETKTDNKDVAPTEDDHAVVLATRFALALDTRISAAFMVAEERYQARVRMWAGVWAILLSLMLNEGLNTGYSTLVAIVIGAVAVPLAPVAKDLAAGLTGAVSAWKDIGKNLKGS